MKRETDDDNGKQNNQEKCIVLKRRQLRTFFLNQSSTETMIQQQVIKSTVCDHVKNGMNIMFYISCASCNLLTEIKTYTQS